MCGWWSLGRRARQEARNEKGEEKELGIRMRKNDNEIQIRKEKLK